MQKDLKRGGSSRWRLASLIVFIVIMVFAVLGRASNEGAVALIYLGIAVVIVALILFAFRRSLGKNARIVQDLRQKYPVAYLCYYETGRRGAITAKDGELITWIIKGKTAKENEHFAPGNFLVKPAQMQLTAARSVDGLAIMTAVTENDLGTVRLALSHDDMTLFGNLLKGEELTQAIAKLQKAK